MPLQALRIISVSSLNSNWSYKRKRSIWVKIGDFLTRVTLKFDEWPWKKLEHLFDSPSSFVHNTIANCKFKPKLQSGDAIAGQYRQIIGQYDLEIWQMTSKNYKAPLLCQFKLCTSFHRHPWIETGVRVRKHSVRPVRTWDLMSVL